MADATTPNFGFVLPTVGLDRDTWGDLTNGNWSKLDTTLGTINGEVNAINSYLAGLVANIVAYIEPVGSMKPWPVPTPPAGWLACDGYEVGRTDYADLFAVIGTTWGAGNGSTTFNVPNWQGYVPVHRGWWMPGVATKLGEAAHTLVEAELAPHKHQGYTSTVGDHTHGYNAPTLQPGAWFPYGANFQIGGASSQTGGAGGHNHTIDTDWHGGGQAHNNIQPSVGALWIIKAFHVGF